MSEVKESATMKIVLFKHWNESPSTPNGKAHKTQQLNNIRQQMFIKYLPYKLGIGPKRL